jgi:hypothetical protein
MDFRTSRNRVGIEPFRAEITNFPHAIASASDLPSDIMPFADEDYRLNSAPRTGPRPRPAYRLLGTAGTDQDPINTVMAGGVERHEEKALCLLICNTDILRATTKIMLLSRLSGQEFNRFN